VKRPFHALADRRFELDAHEITVSEVRRCRFVRSMLEMLRDPRRTPATCCSPPKVRAGAKGATIRPPSRGQLEARLTVSRTIRRKSESAAAPTSRRPSRVTATLLHEVFCGAQSPGQGGIGAAQRLMRRHAGTHSQLCIALAAIMRALVETGRQFGRSGKPRRCAIRGNALGCFLLMRGGNRGT